MDLSTDQRHAFDTVIDWQSGNSASLGGHINGLPSHVLRLGGYAGTGKTTILGELARHFSDKGLLVAYATFTGRASSILRGKLQDNDVESCNRLLAATNSTAAERFPDFFLQAGEEHMAFCGTLHRLLYRPIIDDRTEEVTGYVKRNRLDRAYDLIVLDEASMVGDRLFADVAFHGVPVLAVGDHGQLGPVSDRGTLMANPDIRLEKIHRQAEGSPIIDLSRRIRETGRIGNVAENDVIRVGRRSDTALAKLFAEAPLEKGFLCWQNKTRVMLNRQARKTLGREGPPRTGEPMICLKNYADVGLYNGMRGVCGADATPRVGDPRGWLLDADVDFPAEGVGGTYALCGYQIHRERVFADLDELHRRAPAISRFSDAGLLFDYAYAATVHKFQGSQLQHAIVVVDWPDNGTEESRRMAYTAVTRASERLTIAR
jgi:exodeoxyribonuclease-5